MTEKTLEKITNKLTDTVLEELDAMSAGQLHKVVADAEAAILKATKERNENREYQAAKQAVSDLSAGLKDTKAYQGAKIQYALLRLRELDAEDLGEIASYLDSIRTRIRNNKKS